MSKLTFYNLNNLIPDMIRKEVEKEHFYFEYANQKIDCVLCLKNVCCELLVGIHAINFGFVINILKNINNDYIAEITDSDYHKFCDALNLTYRNNGFNSNTLLKLLSSHIPSTSKGTILDYSVLREYIKCRHIDEPEKIYFCGWNDHIRDKKNARNFDKTEFYLGIKIANYCRENNISSMWSGSPKDEEKITNPWDK